MAEGNGWLKAGNRAKSITAMLVLAATISSGVVGGFLFGVRHATSDIRAQTINNAAKNNAQDEAIGSMGQQMYRVEQRLYYLSVAMDPASTAQEKRKALSDMRAIGAGIPITGH